MDWQQRDTGAAGGAGHDDVQSSDSSDQSPHTFDSPIASSAPQSDPQAFVPSAPSQGSDGELRPQSSDIPSQPVRSEQSYTQPAYRADDVEPQPQSQPQSQPWPQQSQSDYTRTQSQQSRAAYPQPRSQAGYVQPQTGYVQSQAQSRPQSQPWPQPTGAQPQPMYPQQVYVQPQAGYAQWQPQAGYPQPWSQAGYTQPQAGYPQSQPRQFYAQPQSQAGYVQSQSQPGYPQTVYPQQFYSQPQSGYSQPQPQTFYQQPQSGYSQPQSQAYYPQPQPQTYSQFQPQPQQPVYTQPQPQQPVYVQPQPLSPRQAQKTYRASVARWYSVNARPWLASVRQTFSTVGFALVLVIVLWEILGALIASMFTNYSKLPAWATLLIGNGPLYLVAIPLSLLVFRRLPTVQRTTSRLGLAQFLGLFTVTFPISYIGSLIGNILSALFSNGKAQNSTNQLLGRLDLGSVLLFTVIIAPLFEELLFRRLVIDRLLPYGEKLAIVVSAVAFGLFHRNLFQFFYAVGLGLVLGYVYVRTGRLRYSIAMHMLFNFFGGFLPELLMTGMSDKALAAIDQGSSSAIASLIEGGHILDFAPILLFALFKIVMVIVGIVVAIVNRRKLIFHRTPQEVPAGLRVRVALGNAGAITFVVVCAILMVVSLLMS